MIRTFALMMLTAAVLGLAGCQCCNHRPVATRTTVVPGQPGCPPGGVAVPPAPAPLGAGAPAVVQPPSFPGPGAAPAITPAPLGPPPPPAPPPNVTPLAPQASQLPPRLEPNWQPAEARGPAPQIAQAGADPLLQQPGNGAPRPLPTGPTTPRLYPPEVQEQSTAEPPLLQEKTPPRVSEQRPATSLPAGIAQFVPAIPGLTRVSAGQRPWIDDGLDWLAKHDYKTVLHLRAPGEADGPDRRQVEKLGMTYISLEVSPTTLSRETFDRFAKIVGDVAGRPLFVYDQDGSLAGAMWYVYFRRVSGVDGDVAQVRAEGLGLRPEADEAHRQMWLAAKKYLAENP